ncbi:MAG: metal ABC transporter permease [Pseudomonadota bacterium]
MGAEFVQISLIPILIGIFSAIACALPGNFLLLRGQALLGDAIAHVVLPGIVVAFLLGGAIATWPMMAGAAGAALIAIGMIEAIRRFGGVEPGAAMGVSFTALFALGVLLMELSEASAVHLDDHALRGNLESLIWFSATGWSSLWDPEALADLPLELARIAGAAAVIGLLTWFFWRPLALSTFDEAHARALGLPTTLISVGLVTAAAAAAVASFQAVGSIIVIAMFICPPAAARLMTHRLDRQVAWSLLFAAASAVLGYVVAGYGPGWFGADYAVSAAGMIAVISGAILGLACLFGPRRQPAEREGSVAERDASPRILDQ